MKNIDWDKKLNITTSGRIDSHADEYHHPYEATPYGVLERLADSGYIDDECIVVDYGCGKGRVGFFLNDAVGCKVRGVEYDEALIGFAEENLRKYGGENAVEFFYMNAEDFCPTDENVFYFFNPFSAKILNSVLARIQSSYYDNPRGISLIFYYPDDEYISLLMTNPVIMFTDEIDCRDLFDGKNSRERILIFEIM